MVHAKILASWWPVIEFYFPSNLNRKYCWWNDPVLVCIPFGFWLRLTDVRLSRHQGSVSMLLGLNVYSDIGTVFRFVELITKFTEFADRVCTLILIHAGIDLPEIDLNDTLKANVIEIWINMHCISYLWLSARLQSCAKPSICSLHHAVVTPFCLTGVILC